MLAPAPYMMPNVTAFAACLCVLNFSATSSTGQGSLNTFLAIVLWKLPPDLNTSINALSFAKIAATYTSAVVKSIATILLPGAALIHPFTMGLSLGNCCMLSLPLELSLPLVVPCRLKPVRSLLSLSNCGKILSR